MDKPQQDSRKADGKKDDARKKRDARRKERARRKAEARKKERARRRAEARKKKKSGERKTRVARKASKRGGSKRCGRCMSSKWASEFFHSCGAKYESRARRGLCK